MSASTTPPEGYFHQDEEEEQETTSVEVLMDHISSYNEVSIRLKALELAVDLFSGNDKANQNDALLTAQEFLKFLKGEDK